MPEKESTASNAARNSLFRRLLAVADMLSAAFAYAVVVPLLGHENMGLSLLVVIPSIVVICKISGLYDRDEYLMNRSTLDEAPSLFRVSGLYTLLTFLASSVLVSRSLDQGQAVAFWGLLFVLMLTTRWLARQIAGWWTPPERCLILANADAARWLSTKLQRSHGVNVDVVGRIPFCADDSDAGSVPRLGSFDDFERLAEEYQVDRALIAPGRGDSFDHDVLRAIRLAKRLGVRVTVLPRSFEVVGSAVEFDNVEGATLVGVRRHGLSRSSQLVKRGFDLVGATLGLLLLGPLMTIIAVAIKLDSRGPVVFRQARVGRGDRTFEIFKFRTMVDNADAQRGALAHRNEAEGGLFKIEDDPRITPVGALLRRTSLDELPQLFNVLSGDMSLVGPRPLVCDEDSQLEGWKRHRLLLPPGVTGMWQILGSARIPMSEMVKIDYLYGANWSLWLDIKILLRTIPFVVTRRGM